MFAAKNSGITRNVVINQSGEIIFLTRLFDKDEYQEMLRVIEKNI